jgi:methylated-DNA-protein-cysteine methyltransferase-like protein
MMPTEVRPGDPAGFSPDAVLEGDLKTVARKKARGRSGADRAAAESIRESDGDIAPQKRGLSDFTHRVHTVVRAVPHGMVVSYGGVAAIMGQPRAARAVGRALCALPDGSEVPWWRVINRNAEISIRCVDHGPALQRALLEREGVRFDHNGRTDWKRFGWDGSGVPAGIREDDDIDAALPARRTAATKSPTARQPRKRSKRAAGTRR